MKETTDFLENIVDILHAARKKNKKIGAHLKHFYLSKDSIRVHLTGNGQVVIDRTTAENGIQNMNPEKMQKILESFEIK